MTPNPTSAPAPQERKIEIAAQMRALISPFFKTAVEDALATQDVAAFWEDVDAAIFHGMAKYTNELADEAEREPVNIWKSLPRCCGYPRCDGDLVGTSHEPGCPLFGKPEPTPAQRVAAWLREKAQ